MSPISSIGSSALLRSQHSTPPIASQSESAKKRSSQPPPIESRSDKLELSQAGLEKLRQPAQSLRNSPKPPGSQAIGEATVQQTEHSNQVKQSLKAPVYGTASAAGTNPLSNSVNYLG